MRRRLRQRAEKEQDRDVKDGAEREDDDALFAVSSSSSSSKEEDATRKRTRRQESQWSKRSTQLRRETQMRRKEAVGEIVVVDDDSDEDAGANHVDGSAAPNTKKQESWECAMCTFLNETSSHLCEVCNSPAQPSRKLRNLSQWLTPATTTSLPKTQAKRKKARGDADPFEVIDSSGDSDEEKKVIETTFENSRGNDTKRSVPTRANALWADSHFPSTVDDLCVNKKKLQELSEWMNRHAWSGTHSVHPRKRLLFLCGPPGSGKSTSVRCIAQQMGIDVKEWNDNTTAGKLSYERMLQDQYWTQQTSSADDFMDFISRSANYAALPIVPSTNATRSRPRHRKRKLPSQVSPEGSQQSPSHVFSSQVILIENWPQTWSKQESSWEDKVQKIFKLIVDPSGNNRFPVICIFSDVRENKIDLNHLVRLFSADVMHSPFTTVINFNAVTAAQLKKHLVRIATVERCSIDPSDIQHIVDKSDGDIRHAINMLQLVAHRSHRSRKQGSSSSQKVVKKRSAAAAINEPISVNRDPFFSDFHIVGKLLHGKMKQQKTTSVGAEGISSINYDQIMDASAMSLEKVLELVHENCVDYFSQVEELGDAMELLSMTESILSESYKGTSSSESFKHVRGVAQAILVRTIAVTNEHPTPTAFRPISGPRGFATRQRMSWKKEEMLRMTRGSSSESVDPQRLRAAQRNYHYVCSGDTFAHDVEPFLGLINRNNGQSQASSAHTGSSIQGSLPLLEEEVDDEIESSEDGEW